MVSDQEFDEIFSAQVRASDVWERPRSSRDGDINHRRGRGLYFADPDGHLLEIMTVPE